MTTAVEEGLEESDVKNYEKELKKLREGIKDEDGPIFVEPEPGSKTSEESGIEIELTED